ncbi:unnamed protein product [Mytilus edulis]|uniref:K Homology domain-containing protein n=1 Tax=Mytilus edulis TaxID=6550 RepID=A0A8S3S5A0_MYTED|nr:unnamed protein product [Mytilus edulis]
MDWKGTEVEVDMPNGACYQASIKDITESGILIVFKDDLKPETSVTFEKVKLLPHQEEESFDFKQGDIIQSTSEDLNKKAEVLTDVHVKALKEMSQQRHERQYLEKNKHTETFMVTSDVAGLAIGRKHANIKKLNTPQAVEKARSLLEFKKEQLTVPHHFAGRIIGKAGKAIDEIIDKSMVDRIIRQTEQDASKNYCPDSNWTYLKEVCIGVVFNIIGTPESIENAKVLINFKLDALKNLYTSKIDIRDAERSDIWSDDENSSCFISSENISSIQHTPSRRRGNRTGRRSRGGRGNRFRGGQRGRNNHTEEESKQYQNYMKSDVSQQDVRATDKNDGFLLDSKTLVADSEGSSDDTLSCASINSEQHYPVHKPPNRSSWNGSRPRRRCRGGRGGRYRERLNSGDNQPSEDQISHFAYLDEEKEGLWLKYDAINAGTHLKQKEVDDNVGGIVFEQSSGGVRHKDIWNKPKAKDTGTRAEECYFPKHIEVGINKSMKVKRRLSSLDDKFSTGEDFTKSLVNFDSLLDDTPKVKTWVESKEMKEKRLMEEQLDRINEMQVLKI